MMTEDDGTASVVEGAAQLGLLTAELPIRLTVAHGKPCGAVKCNGKRSGKLCGACHGFTI